MKNPMLVEDDENPVYLEEEAWLAKHGYIVVNTSYPRPGVREVRRVEDIRPSYDVIHNDTGKQIAGIIECSYSHALVFARRHLIDKGLVPDDWPHNPQNREKPPE
jgi:hypothetical protein